MLPLAQALAEAVQHHRQGRLLPAEQAYRQILARWPGHPDALHLLGLVAHQLGRHDEALGLVTQAIQRHAPSAAYHCTQGLIHAALGQLAEATACQRRALALEPNAPELHLNLGGALAKQGQTAAAIAAYRRALELMPDYPAALVSLAGALADQQQWDESAACCRRALELSPGSAEACINLTSALFHLGRLDEAVAAGRRAIELAPDSFEAHHNLGMALRWQGALDDALNCYRRALELRPDHAEAHTVCALIRLQRGDFAAGWPQYEWRFKSKHGPSSRRGFPQPAWNAEPIAGKTILLTAEQGLGDSLQFIRYASDVQQFGARVVFECPATLAELMKSCSGIDEAVRAGDELPSFDVHLPLLSLPRVFETRLDSIPVRTPYLRAPAELAALWRARLPPDGKFKIAIAWQGNPAHPRDRYRSFPLACFQPLAQLPNVRLYSLQVGAGRDQLLDSAAFAAPPIDLADDLVDFQQTAAALANLDLLVTCDSALAHLAGALGVPVWVALPKVCDWRWLTDREDSPWYPTLRLFRQRTLGDWPEVFERIRCAMLSQIAAARIRP